MIDHTKVPSTDQTNFPVLISGTYGFLEGIKQGGQVWNPNGYDIIFTSDAAGQNFLLCFGDALDFIEHVDGGVAGV